MGNQSKDDKKLDTTAGATGRSESIDLSGDTTLRSSLLSPVPPTSERRLSVRSNPESCHPKAHLEPTGKASPRRSSFGGGEVKTPGFKADTVYVEALKIPVQLVTEGSESQSDILSQISKGPLSQLRCYVVLLCICSVTAFAKNSYSEAILQRVLLCLPGASEVSRRSYA